MRNTAVTTNAAALRVAAFDHLPPSDASTACQLEMTAQIRRNAAGAPVAQGYVLRDTGKTLAIDIGFAPNTLRRRSALLSRIERAWRKARAHADRSGVAISPDDVRVMLLAKGHWTSHFEEDAQGWQYRRYEFIALSWQMAAPRLAKAYQMRLPARPQGDLRVNARDANGGRRLAQR